MQIRIEEVYWLKLDREEAEQFLEDPSDAQAKIRAALYSNHRTDQEAPSAAQRAPMARVAPVSSLKVNGNGHVKDVSPKASRREVKKIPCPDCDEMFVPGWLARHRAKEHGVVPTASELSAA